MVLSVCGPPANLKTSWLHRRDCWEFRAVGNHPSHISRSCDCWVVVQPCFHTATLWQQSTALTPAILVKDGIWLDSLWAFMTTDIIFFYVAFLFLSVNIQLMDLGKGGGIAGGGGLRQCMRGEGAKNTRVSWTGAVISVILIGSVNDSWHDTMTIRTGSSLHTVSKWSRRCTDLMRLILTWFMKPNYRLK